MAMGTERLARACARSHAVVRPRDRQVQLRRVTDLKEHSPAKPASVCQSGASPRRDRRCAAKSVTLKKLLCDVPGAMGCTRNEQ
jgi:hypothetical protein